VNAGATEVLSPEQQPLLSPKAPTATTCCHTMSPGRERPGPPSAGSPSTTVRERGPAVALVARHGSSLSRTVARATHPRGPSAHDDAEAAVETVLPVVEEGTQSQGDRQGGQLLLQHPPDAPVTVQEPCRGTG